MVSTGTVACWRSERQVIFHHPFIPLLRITYPQDRFAGLSGPGSFRGGPGGFRGGMRGLRGGGFRGGGFRGGFRGGFGGQAGVGRDFSNQDLYADYSGPDQQAAAPTGPGQLRMDGHGYHAGGFAGAGAGFGGAPAYAEPEPSQQIMVRNVRLTFLS